MPVQLSFSVLVFVSVALLLENPLAEEPNFALSIFIHCLAAFIENLTEPYYYTMLWKGDLQGKVKTELVALTFKSLLTYFLLLRNFNLLAYALS